MLLFAAVALGKAVFSERRELERELREPECRDAEGQRCSQRDLELEVYRSGDDINLMLSWWEQPDRPMLWQGRHPVWMDGATGQRCSAPHDAAPIEALARRLRSLLQNS